MKNLFDKQTFKVVLNIFLVVSSFLYLFIFILKIFIYFLISFFKYIIYIILYFSVTSITTLGESNTIRPLDLSKGATFDFKHGFLQMLENNPFSGATLEDSMHNLKKLIKLSNIARQNHASVEYVRLYAFPFSLNRKAWDWLSSLPVNNISSWNQCKNTFSLP